MNTTLLSGLCLLALSTTTAAQAPQYIVTPAAKPGGSLPFALVGQPGQAYASYVDATGGPRLLLGEELFVGLTPALTLIDMGVFGIGGLRSGSYPVPAPGVASGVVFYMQSIVADASAPNSAFRASNGESTVLYNSSAVMVEEMTDPVLQGFVGNYDRSRKFRLQASAPVHRVRTIQPTQGIVFGSPLVGALNPDGARLQMVYRAGDLGATGVPEVLTQVRWLPFGQVATATYTRLILDVGHTTVVPDYTIGKFSALPVYPQSGLSTTFANNPKANDTPVRIIDQSYYVRQQDVRADGYVSYPTPTQTFVYNGIDSILLDFSMPPMTAAAAANGQLVHLPIQSSWLPASRVVANGTASAKVNPFTVTQGNGDNTIYYMQFEFAKVHSVAESPWRKAPVAQPNYHTPVIAQALPPGTSVVVEYRGATNASGVNASPWSTNVDNADTQPYLQYRITLTANPWTGATPSVESIVVPIN